VKCIMSESSVVDKDIGAITSTTRKNAVKGRGVDWDLSRRNREDKTVQVRKQKRIDRVNIERRKVVFLVCMHCYDSPYSTHTPFCSQFKLNEDSSEGRQGANRLHEGRSLLNHSQNVLNFTVLPRKCEMLLSEKLEDQLDAAMFFRRILAAGETVM